MNDAKGIEMIKWEKCRCADWYGAGTPDYTGLLNKSQR